MQTADSNQIAVLGLGYVGCVTAACLASLGHRVLGIDRDQHKVDNVLKGRAPFYEPGLEDLVRDGIDKGLLSASTSAEAMVDADIALVCVGTPSEKNGNLGLAQLGRAIDEIAAQIPRRQKPLIVAIRSTVFQGPAKKWCYRPSRGIPVFASYRILNFCGKAGRQGLRRAGPGGGGRIRRRRRAQSGRSVRAPGHPAASGVAARGGNDQVRL